FVFSAAFAREYDGEDLLDKPGYLFIPLVASLASSFLLFSLISVVANKSIRSVEHFVQGYLSLLSLFWMTAPLAWLYAIPYERFMSSLDAMRASLVTLAVVAAWRVVLMIRVLVVLSGAGIFAASFIVLLFGDAVALLVSVAAPLPIPLIEVMGGVRPSPEL